MNHLKAAFYKVVVAVLCVSLLLTGCMMRLRNEPGKEETDAWFRENKADILLVTEYLLQLEYDYCYIWDENSELSVLKSVQIPVDNPEFYPAVKRLFENKCYRITKKNDTIDFLLWTFFDGRGKGLAYSPDSKVPSIQCLMDCELIEGETDWYYYLDDYETWRAQGRPNYTFPKDD